MNKEKKSISQLEGWSWNTEIPSKEDSSYEEYNFYLLHNKPIKDYTPSDIYFMIGQESGLKHIVPLAIELLDQNILLKAEDYPGDLLGRVLLVPRNFWNAHSDFYRKMSKMIKNSKGKIDSFHSTADIKTYLTKALNNFLILEVS